MKRFLIIALAAVFALVFAACGEKKPAEEQPTAAPTAAPAETAPAEQSTEQPTEAATEAPDSGVETSVAEYAGFLKLQVDSIAAQVADTMSLDCYAEGRSIVFEYKYLSEDIVADADALRASLDASGESYVTLYQELAGYAGSDTVSIILRYLAADGSKILDYVVDKDYVPGEGTGVKPHYDSLEEFVGSEEFAAMIAQGSVPGVETSAFLEGENTIVYLQKVNEELSGQELEDFRTAWLDGIRESGDAAAQTFVSAIKLLVDIEEVNFVFRVVDNAGEMIAEYTANTGDQ